MAINKNHEFEDLGDQKCAIVEKNVSPERTAFLKELLEFNKFTVVVVSSPPPKATPTPKPVAVAEGEQSPPPPPPPAEPPAPSTFTIGVTDVTFNATNAIFGRLLKTPDGHVVTLHYWLQKESVPRDEIPYFENPAK